MVRSNAPWGAHVTCAPLFFPGAWDAAVVPAGPWLADPGLRRRTPADVVVYGSEENFGPAWRTGILDYLREPWQPEELFLRLRGPESPTVVWDWAGKSLRLDGNEFSTAEGDRVRLSSAEANLLRILVRRRGLPVSRGVLAWAAGCSSGRVIDTLVGRLRNKLRPILAADAPLPVSVRGVGYRLP